MGAPSGTAGGGLGGGVDGGGVLGGVLGLIVGLVQVHLLFAVPLGAAATAVWVAYRLNERRYRDR